MISVVKLDRARFGLRSDSFSQTLVKVGRIVPGLSWESTLKAWVGYPDVIELGCLLLRGAGLKVEDGEKLDPNLWGEPLALPSMSDLRDYQKLGVNFILTHAAAGCLLADDMGLGKTAQTIRALRAWKSKALIVCPKFVRGVWIDELFKWWPEITFQVLEGPMGRIGTSDVVVTHYDILHRWIRQLVAWAPRAVVFDECHMLMTETSRRTKASLEISSKTPLRIGLSGTPMTNRPRDLFSVVEVLSPGRFGGAGRFFGFGLRYCDGKKEQVTPEKTVWKFDGASRQQELARRLSWMMLRRRVEEVMKELPPISRQVIWLDGVSKHPWKGGVKSLKELRGLLDRAADKKLPEVLDMVRAAREGGGTIVVFCYRRTVTEWMAEKLLLEGETAAFIHGGMPTATRSKRLEQAKSWGRGGVLAVTIDSCGVGISFAFARAAIFAELCYEPWKLRQAERRVARFGQKAGSVLIQYAIARGTADELVLDKVIGKLDVEGGLGLGDAGEMKGSFVEGGEERVLSELYAL